MTRKRFWANEVFNKPVGSAQAGDGVALTSTTHPTPQTETINVRFRPGLPYHKQVLAIGAAKALAQVKAQMDRMPVPHLRVDGADRCPVCGTPVSRFDLDPCI